VFAFAIARMIGSATQAAIEVFNLKPNPGKSEGRPLLFQAGQIK
jgi:hypothetical protein